MDVGKTRRGLASAPPKIPGKHCGKPFQFSWDFPISGNFYIFFPQEVKFLLNFPDCFLEGKKWENVIMFSMDLPLFRAGRLWSIWNFGIQILKGEN